MANRQPEQQLITTFVELARSSEDDDLAIARLINCKCRSKRHADIEYMSKSGLHWIIEAKTHDSKDRHNAVHKIFGELLKETGRIRDSKRPHFGLLLPYDRLQFFGRGFLCVEPNRFARFGELVPISTVFAIASGELIKISWNQMRGYRIGAKAI